MKIANALHFLDKIVSQTAKKGSADNELVVIEWALSGALLVHVELSPSPMIKRFSRLNFDASMTDAEKRGAFIDFLSAIPEKKRPKAALCWSDGMTFRQLALPDMPREDFLKALDWDLKKKYYFNSAENLLGYQEASDVEGEEGPEKLYSVFYCESKTALPRIEQVADLGLQVQALIPGPAALARFAASYAPDAEKDTLVCDIGEEMARIVIARESRVMLVRSISHGAAGIVDDEALARIAQEVRKTLDFYESQKYARTVGCVFFTGERCEPTRVLDFMTAKTGGAPVTVPVIDRFLSGALDASDRESAVAHAPSFATALGTALASNDPLNLVPDEIKTKNRLGRLNRLLALGMIAFALLLSAFAGLTAVQLKWAKSHLAGLHEEYATLDKNRQVLEGMLGRSRVRRTTLKGDVPVYALLKELSLLVPGTIALNQLQYNRSDGSLTLSGQINDPKRESAKNVTQLAESLGQSIFFSTASVTRSEPDDENNVLRFEISTVTKGLSV